VKEQLKSVLGDVASQSHICVMASYA